MLPCGTARSALLSSWLTRTLQNNSATVYASVPQKDSDPQSYRGKYPNAHGILMAQPRG